jgi:hypothetical protein
MLYLLYYVILYYIILYYIILYYIILYIKFAPYGAARQAAFEKLKFSM